MSHKKKILFICGSVNQTTMLHAISSYLKDYDNYFTPYYTNGILKLPLKLGLLNFSVLGGKLKKLTENYIKEHDLRMDYEGKKNDYNLIVTCSDLMVQKNIKDKKVLLVQEGMTDPETLAYHIVKYLHLPRYYGGGTASTGLSDAYDIFCVASEGYKDLFVKKGCNPEKIRVTGIPNFDNSTENWKNEFPHKNYVLVCTSDSRETYKTENRKKFILKARAIAKSKQIIFKLHPNENVSRAKREIKKWAPGSLVYTTGNTNHMIASCDVLITKYSSVVYVGMALGKEVHSLFNMEELKKLIPIQNEGTSAKKIANICELFLNGQ
jgi:hypothetical protein